MHAVFHAEKSLRIVSEMLEMLLEIFGISYIQVIFQNRKSQGMLSR